MTLFLIAYAGGVLTILSPCILPVLPFIFARADRPFVKNGLPMLAGMAATFAGIATLAAVGGGWAVTANEIGRYAALALLALFGLALLIPELSERLTRPLVALGARLSERADSGAANGATVGASALLGVATGLLWAPCAGPILGLILTGAALNGANIQTSLLLLAYAAGAATSLAVALLAGGRIFAALKNALGVGEWVRRGLGAAVLVAVAAIALGADSGILTRLSQETTAALEQRLLDTFDAGKPAPAPSVVMKDGDAMMGGPAMMSAAPTMTGAGSAVMSANPAMRAEKSNARQPDEPLAVEGEMPELSGAVEWLNSPPLSKAALKGKVVLIDFWTYSCINCLRAIPYVRAWAERYKDQGLVVIGVHTPEFAFEKKIANVKGALSDLGISYPVAIDNDYAIWRAFDNHYWPAHYFIDAEGRVRHHHFGEGDYEGSERVIRALLAEAGRTVKPAAVTDVAATGAEMASDQSTVRSPETYVGYARAENFISPGGLVENAAHAYAAAAPRLNEWALSGDWTVAAESARLNAKGGAITYRFHARDLHLVLGPGEAGAPVRFRITIDGRKPGDDHGMDTDAEGNGVVTGQRLYQLVRQTGEIADRTFEIQFLDPGVEAYAFTFG